MKRRIIALAVALFMVLTMVPMTGNAAYAASPNTAAYIDVVEVEPNDSMGKLQTLNNSYDQVVVWGNATAGNVDWYAYQFKTTSDVDIEFRAATKTAKINVYDYTGAKVVASGTTTNPYMTGVYNVKMQAAKLHTLCFIEVSDTGASSAGDPYTIIFTRTDYSTGGGDDSTTHVCEFKEVKRVDKTCTAGGYVKKECSCGKTKTEILDAGHEYGDRKTVREATCKVVAKYERTCALCGKVLTTTGTTYGDHKIVDVAEKAATCKEEGHKAGKQCEYCGMFTEGGEAIAKGGHKEVVVPAVAATCTATGLTEGKKCELCGTVTVKQTTVAKTAHVVVTIPAVEATCTTAGKTEGKECKYCGLITTAQKTVKAKGHTEVTDKAVAATCTKEGKTEGKHCSVCNEVTVKQEVVKALGHKEVVDAGYAATCTATGLTDGKHCTVCSAVTVKQEVIKALGHKEVVDAAVAATCTTDGKTEGKHCDRCNAVLVAQNVIWAFGHSEVANVETAATTEIEGLVKTTCTTCNAVTNEKVVPMIGTVKLAATKYVYNGKVRTPKVTINDADGNPIDAANYTVKTPAGRKNTGKYTYTVTFQNEYSGTVTLTMQIAPKAPVAKAPAAVKKGATVKWNKVAGNITGYEVVVATNKAFTKGKKTVTVKGAKVVSKKVTGLKAKTKYWVKVRAYKQVGKEKIYSSWSAVKTIKTKQSSGGKTMILMV